MRSHLQKTKNQTNNNHLQKAPGPQKQNEKTPKETVRTGVAGLEENKNHSVLGIVGLLFLRCMCSGEGGSLFENSPKKWCYTKFSKNNLASSLGREKSEGGEEGGEFQG